MNEGDRSMILAIPAVLAVGAGVAWAGSQGGADFLGVPLFAFCVGLAFLVQWLAFIPAYLYQTEKFYDLTGSLTYISITVLAVAAAPARGAREFLLAALVVIWAGRLGTFLFRRVMQHGKDDRFDDLKPSFLRFLNAWNLQGLWITFTAAAALASITNGAQSTMGWPAAIGLVVWLVGFGFEAVADWQKSKFRADPANKGKFIKSGLWSLSRHPNYFGEIVLWIGVAIIALPDLRGWQLVGLISPVFVTLLITQISGVPLLEKKAEEKWGGQPDYEEYKESTPVLIPWPSASD